MARAREGDALSKEPPSYRAEGENEPPGPDTQCRLRGETAAASDAASCGTHAAAGGSLLAPARARTFYAAADALGAGEHDLAPALQRWLEAAPPREAHAFLRFLAWLEQVPRVTPAGRHGYAWLPREARARWLTALAWAPLPGVARAVAALRAVVAEALQWPPGP